jgi:excisionase family DNA binding protein
MAGLPTTAPVLLCIEDAAKYIGRNVPFMRRLVANRRIPFYKPGYVLRFDTRDLDAYLASCRVEPWLS